MDAILLAAGRGKRMGVLTKLTPKCMVKLAGKPLIGWVYDVLLQAGIDNIYIVAGYKKDVLGEFIHRRYDNAHIVIQKRLNGTADALTHVSENLLSDSFLVLASDAIYSYEDIKELMKKPNSLLYTKYDEDLHTLGTIEMNNDNIIHIHEKKTKPVSNIVNISAYHFTKGVYNYLEDTPFHPEYKEQIITETINRMIIDGIEFTGIEASTWYHISKKEDIDNFKGRLVWKRRK